MNRIKPVATRRTQQGITLVLISLIMLILIGMGGFAIDLNHQVLNKARLQNAVDSAALASAVVADSKSGLGANAAAVAAEIAAVQALNSFAEGPGNEELAYRQENISVTFSNDKQTFVGSDTFAFGNDSDIYVRVAVSDVSLTQYLSHIFGVGKGVSASAVAGPSSAINRTCNLEPMAVCGDPSSSDNVWGYNPNGYDPAFFKDPNTIHALKVADHNNTDMGPGNFQLIDFNQGTFEEEESNGNGNGSNDGGGAALVREALAGAYKGCATVGDKVITKPGNSIGPVAQGINTRLNDFTGPIKSDGVIFPDIYVKEANITTGTDSTDITSSDFYYADYEACKNGGCGNSTDYPSNGKIERRVLRIPIVDCTSDSTGKTEFSVLGFGCFFLMQRVSNNAGQDANVYGQFLNDCLIKNGSTSITSSDAGFYKIQLYKDPLSGAS